MLLRLLTWLLFVMVVLDPMTAAWTTGAWTAWTRGVSWRSTPGAAATQARRVAKATWGQCWWWEMMSWILIRSRHQAWSQKLLRRSLFLVSYSLTSLVYSWSLNTALKREFLEITSVLWILMMNALISIYIRFWLEVNSALLWNCQIMSLESYKIWLNFRMEKSLIQSKSFLPNPDNLFLIKFQQHCLNYDSISK